MYVLWLHGKRGKQARTIRIGKMQKNTSQFKHVKRYKMHAIYIERKNANGNVFYVLRIFQCSDFPLDRNKQGPTEQIECNTFACPVLADERKKKNKKKHTPNEYYLNDMVGKVFCVDYVAWWWGLHRATGCTPSPRQAYHSRTNIMYK